MSKKYTTKTYTSTWQKHINALQHTIKNSSSTHTYWIPATSLDTLQEWSHSTPREPCGISISIPILQKRKLKLKEVNDLPKAIQLVKWQRQNSNLDLPPYKLQVFPMIYYSLFKWNIFLYGFYITWGFQKQQDLGLLSLLFIPKHGTEQQSFQVSKIHHKVLDYVPCSRLLLLSNKNTCSFLPHHRLYVTFLFFYLQYLLSSSLAMKKKQKTYPLSISVLRKVFLGNSSSR